MSTSTEATAAAATQAAIGAYAQALDTGRTDDLAELFWPDGAAEIAGIGTFEGQEAIRKGYEAFAPTQPQLHLVANTVVTAVTEDEATAVSNLAYFQRGEAGWAVQMVGRYDDTLTRRDGVWRFQKRVTSFLP